MMKHRSGLAAGIAALVLICALAVGAGWLAGYRFLYVTTPSMGTALPVGALAYTTPASVESVSVGEVVTTRLQNGHSRTHRVVEKTPDGLITKGDLNGGNDAGVTTNRNLVGRVSWSSPVLGWVVQMLPWVLGAWLLMWLVSIPLKDPIHRSRYRSTGAVLGFALAIVVVQPLLGVHLLAIRVEAGEDPRAEADFVSTGLLPTKVDPYGDNGEGSEIMPTSGHTSSAVARTPNAKGDYVFQPRPAIGWKWWVAAIALVLSPWLWFYLQYARNQGNKVVEDNAQISVAELLQRKV